MSLRRNIAIAVLGMGLSASAWAAGCTSGKFNDAAGTKIVDIENAKLDQDDKALASLGPQTIYPAAGSGYSSGELADGRYIGLQFRLTRMPDCSLAADKPVSFDLKDPAQMRSFQFAIDQSAMKQASAGHPQPSNAGRNVVRIISRP